jgi:hypothetical protein
VELVKHQHKLEGLKIEKDKLEQEYQEQIDKQKCLREPKYQSFED